jgi:uncharacterized protein
MQHARLHSGACPPQAENSPRRGAAVSSDHRRLRTHTSMMPIPGARGEGPNSTRFFVVTFLWTWLLWLPFALGSLGYISIDDDVRRALLFPALFLGAFGPAVGACYSVATLHGKSQLKTFLKSFLSIRFGWKVWISIFAVLGGINVVAWYIPELFGHDRLGMLLPSVFVFPVVWLFMVVLGGGQEEIGWRGYAMPLLESRYGLWTGNLILGLVWSLWHVPLWFIPESNQVYMPFAAFVIGHIGLSFFFSWVVKASNGRPGSALIAHGTSNAFISVFPTFVAATGVVQIRLWIHEPMIFVAGAIFMIALQSRLAGDRAPRTPEQGRVGRT